jgi:hypothetical protein
MPPAADEPAPGLSLHDSWCLPVIKAVPGQEIPAREIAPREVATREITSREVTSREAPARAPLAAEIAGQSKRQLR